MGITGNINIIQNKKKDHWEMDWTKSVLTTTIEALQKDLLSGTMRYTGFLFCNSLENYSSISKLLNDTHMHLILQLITHYSN